MFDKQPVKIRKRSLSDELRTLSRIMFDADKKRSDVLFFTTQSQYISYYEGIIKQLVALHKKDLVYLSSDSKDPIFASGTPGVIPYYAETFLPFVFPLIDYPVVVTTVPDLHQYKIKRSFSGTNYVYVFHALVSSHMMYRLGAFDFYDTVFCCGPHHVAEIRRTEELYGLPSKDLYEVGYYRLEKIYRQHQEFVKSNPVEVTANGLVLVAPGWHDSNILNTCGEELIKSLLAEGFNVALRPHPMTIAKSPEVLTRIRNLFANNERFQLDTTTTSETYLHRADVMICDWSGVALEYAFGTERPVLFIDLPRKIYNPEYERLGMEPLEVRIRDQIGKQISPERAKEAGKIALEFLDRKQEYRERILQTRRDNIFNFGRSSIVGAEIITRIVAEGRKGRTA